MFLPFIGFEFVSNDFGGISDTGVETGTAVKNSTLIFLKIIFLLPGSDKEECKLTPLIAFVLLVLATADDDSLLLVDENDIRELSSPIKHNKMKF